MFASQIATRHRRICPQSLLSCSLKSMLFSLQVVTHSWGVKSAWGILSTTVSQNKVEREFKKAKKQKAVHTVMEGCFHEAWVSGVYVCALFENAFLAVS